MILKKNTNILIVGLGVIGGSYAKALTAKGYSVSTITKNKEDLDYAIESGIVKKGSVDVDPTIIANANLIVFALYPTVFIEWIKENQDLFSPGTIITDVTGVKGSVVDEIQRILRNDVEFISAHPMAGRESSGVHYSDPSVFKGANYIITPTQKNTRGAIEICRALGEELGFSKISELSIEEHDKMIAFLSQLTHCIAVSLMTCNNAEGLEKYTGDSFRDLTRIAKINDKMWSELFIMNKKPLLDEMQRFIDEFIRFKEMIEQNDVDGLRAKMRESTTKRALFDKK